MTKYYIKNKNVREISEGFLRFQIDQDSGEVIDMEYHPKLAEILVSRGTITKSLNVDNYQNSDTIKRKYRVKKREVNEAADEAANETNEIRKVRGASFKT